MDTWIHEYMDTWMHRDDEVGYAASGPCHIEIGNTAYHTIPYHTIPYHSIA
jgi:hypothetical protein